jgi:hypothetical protein
MWRAENWHNPHTLASRKARNLSDWDLLHEQIFEAGADAMLRVLREGVSSDLLSSNIPVEIMNRKGKWVFIPDDDNGGADGT